MTAEYITSSVRPDISNLYKLEGFHNAVQYDSNHPRPDVLAITAMKNNEIIGRAGASADCEMMWQIGIDVLPALRNLGIAAVLTRRGQHCGGVARRKRGRMEVTK